MHGFMQQVIFTTMALHECVRLVSCPDRTHFKQTVDIVLRPRVDDNLYNESLLRLWTTAWKKNTKYMLCHGTSKPEEAHAESRKHPQRRWYAASMKKQLLNA